jgi:hypothetical protein
VDPGDALTLQVAIVGDAQPVLPRMPFSGVTHVIMRELRFLGPDLVLYTGDRIWGFGDTPQELRNAYDRFGALAATTGVPFYAVPGNHECQSDKDAIALLEEQGLQLYGAFDVGAYHFVGLHTDEFCREGRITGDQFEWLASDLAAHGDAAATFVFMHRPIHSWFQGDFNPDDARRLHDLFRRHGVRAVFAGHDHFFDLHERDGIAYYTAGGGGGTLYAQPPRGGFSHYLLLRVEETSFHVDVIEPGHLEVHSVAGNDGLEPMTRVRVLNATERRLRARNLELRVPRLSSRELYRLSIDYVEFDGTRVDLDPTLRDVIDNGDGSATLAVEIDLPDGSGFYVTAEAHEPR